MYILTIVKKCPDFLIVLLLQKCTRQTKVDMPDTLSKHLLFASLLKI
jgi:hypothetical protein